MLHGSVDFAVQVNRHGQRLIKFVQRGQQLQTLPGAAVTVTIAIGRDDRQSVNQVSARQHRRQSFDEWVVVIKRIYNIISVHRNRPPVARPVNPLEIRFLA